MRVFFHHNRRFRYAIFFVSCTVLNLGFVTSMYAQDFNPYRDSTGSLKDELNTMRTEYSTILNNYQEYQKQNMNVNTAAVSIFNTYEIGFWLLVIILIIFLGLLFSLRKTMLRSYARMPEAEAPAPRKEVEAKRAAKKPEEATVVTPRITNPSRLVIPPQIVKIKVRKLKKIKK